MSATQIEINELNAFMESIKSILTRYGADINVNNSLYNEAEITLKGMEYVHVISPQDMSIQLKLKNGKHIYIRIGNGAGVEMIFYLLGKDANISKYKDKDITSSFIVELWDIIVGRSWVLLTFKPKEVNA